MAWCMNPQTRPTKTCHTHFNKGCNDGIADALATRLSKAGVFLIVNIIGI